MLSYNYIVISCTYVNQISGLISYLWQAKTNGSRFDQRIHFSGEYIGPRAVPHKYMSEDKQDMKNST